MKISIGLPAKALTAITEILNKLLSDEHILYIKTRNAHWNVEGPDFHSKHEFFEIQYQQLEKMIDEIAERTRMLGGFATGTMKEFLSLSTLKEYNGDKNDSATYEKQLLADHETIIKKLREDISKTGEEHKDEGTADFLTEIMQQHEKMAWMLRAHLS